MTILSLVCFIFWVHYLPSLAIVFLPFPEEADSENSIAVFRNFYIYGGRPPCNWLFLLHEITLLSYAFDAFLKIMILFCLSSVYAISSRPSLFQQCASAGSWPVLRKDLNLCFGLAPCSNEPVCILNESNDKLQITFSSHQPAIITLE